jgi:hypothetical protein
LREDFVSIGKIPGLKEENETAQEPEKEKSKDR